MSEAKLVSIVKVNAGPPPARAGIDTYQISIEKLTQYQAFQIFQLLENFDNPIEDEIIGDMNE